jgi:phospholipid/cholesterol/gamma-HCH transport system substrate-binding protein
LVACLVLVAFGYSGLPFYPQGKNYHAFFSDAGGVSPGDDVTISGIPVGNVKTVSLAGASAEVAFTVTRGLTVGDQSLAAIRADTVLGQKSLAITPKGGGATTEIPLERTTSPYSLNTALQDLGGNVGELDKPQLEEALAVLTDSLQQATPQLRDALDGVAALSRSLNRRDQALAALLGRAKSVTQVLNQRAGQVNKLVTDGNQLFAALDERRQALSTLIGGIDEVSRELSGFVADNRTELTPALTQLNAVMDNLLERRERISGALRRLPGYSTALGEVVSSGPGFNINVYGLPPPTLTEVLFDLYFQPGKVPDSLSDYLRGFIQERAIIRPKSP